MDLLLDIFGFASVLLSGGARTAQCLTLGGIAFIVFIADPVDASTVDGPLLPRTLHFTRMFAWCLLVSVAAMLALQVTVLIVTEEMTIAETLGGDFAVAQIIRIVGVALMLVLLYRPSPSVPRLMVLGVIDLAAGVATSHAMARIDDRALLIAITALHHPGAA